MQQERFSKVVSIEVHNEFSILVVDDDQAISKLIRHNLEGNGTRIIEAANGLDCIKKLREVKVDLILLDIRLPDFNGWGVLSLLRLTEAMRDIPVIMVTVEPLNKVLMDEFRPDDYIQKPFDVQDLLVRVRKVIDSKNAAQRLVSTGM